MIPTELQRADSCGRLLEQRIRDRRGELEVAARARISKINDASPSSDPDYLDNLWTTLASALEYGLEALAGLDRSAEPVPVGLLAQARLAARHRVQLQTVLRRYAAGQSLLVDAVLEEAGKAQLSAAELQVALQSLATRFDRVVVAVSDEYAKEATCLSQEAEGDHALLLRILEGERLDLSHLNYDLDAFHLALVGSGKDLCNAFFSLSQELKRQVLIATTDKRLVWAWIGGPSQLSPGEFRHVSSFEWPEATAVACGEGGNGISGWRVSHQQAAAAHLVAKRTGSLARYPDVAILACALQDHLLASSLRRAYLAPLETNRDGGAAAKETLRAYFASSRNVSSAAAVLGINRRTVSARLATIEHCLDRRLDVDCAELETALRLDALEA